MLAPLYADELLALVLEKFVEMFGKKINDATGTADAFCKEFDAVYDAILRTLEKPVKSKRKPRSFAEAKAKKMAERRERKRREKERKKAALLTADDKKQEASNDDDGGDDENDFEAQRKVALERLKARQKVGAERILEQKGTAEKISKEAAKERLEIGCQG